jgi:RNA polymerase sigma-70 factor, ECF subfamily
MIFRLPGKKTHHRSDEELISAFCDTGNMESLGELFSPYLHLVYGVCLKYLKDRDESKDAVMQIFEKLVTDLPKQRVDNFRTWLYVVTKNFCLMQIRSQRTQNDRFTEWAIDQSVFMETDDTLHPIDKRSSDLEDGLADCIERLKDEQKNCIRLFYYESMCYNEIAGSLKIDEKKVKSHLQNAKRNLKLCLEEKNAEQE